MAMQSDVKATKPLEATGFFKTQTDADVTFRARIKSIYALCGSNAGSVVLRDGSASGPILLTLPTPAASGVGSVSFLVPDQGILAENGIHGTLTNTASITIFYG
jgi:hypothetical protein